MGEHVIVQRGRALENAFFAEQEEILLARLRAADAEASRLQALAATSGISDPVVLRELDALGIRPATVAALTMAPLVLVAWADGTIDPLEKAAVMQAAGEAGLLGRPEAAELLQSWLTAPPSRQLETAWHDHTHAVVARLTAPARAALRQETIGRARRIAEAAGGFLGLLHRVSAAEEAMLARLESAFA
ncbi:hypothetical protein [Falsiroseomonas oryzae]|uniref:hypothetical protein n=1 Tax=Falsiroseomonas oryzae TaxID=2766473 RepID=UPI0022EB6F80|nr:hypothetical protein [Roseomonas sp. MO-31]